MSAVLPAASAPATVTPSTPYPGKTAAALSSPVQITPSGNAHRITSDQEALQIARQLAAKFAVGAAERDRERILPYVELDQLAVSGLLGITVPKSHGGPGVTWATLAEVIRILSAADPSIGQVPQNHFAFFNILRQAGTPEQLAFFYSEALGGARFGNAGPERNAKNILDVQTHVRTIGDHVILNGTRFYSTGALFAHWVQTRAVDEQGRSVFAVVKRGTPGLSIVDDWTGFGQRTTASGTVIFNDVQIPAAHVILLQPVLERPNVVGPVAQLLQAAIDAGIAEAAVRDTVAFVRTRARAWVDSGLERAADDPLTINQVGDLHIRLHAAEALLERAAHRLDALPEIIDYAQMAQAQVNIAEAKALTTEISLLAGQKLFELGGSQATLAADNLDRHWRNARVHTLHDPVRWKIFAVGNFYLNDTPPPRHAWS